MIVNRVPDVLESNVVHENDAKTSAESISDVKKYFYPVEIPQNPLFGSENTEIRIFARETCQRGKF